MSNYGIHLHRLVCANGPDPTALEAHLYLPSVERCGEEALTLFDDEFELRTEVCLN